MARFCYVCLRTDCVVVRSHGTCPQGGVDVAAFLQRAEAKREAVSRDVQVLRQHLSVAPLEDPGRGELKAKLAQARALVQELVDAINEHLEELRCEAADLEE